MIILFFSSSDPNFQVKQSEGEAVGTRPDSPLPFQFSTRWSSDSLHFPGHFMDLS